MSGESPEQKLDHKLLEAFMHGFYGYGNYDSDVWFVGMEEGGGKSYEELRQRLAHWESRGQSELEDLREFNIDLGKEKWFSDNPPLQRTWKGLIRIHLCPQELPPTVADIKNFQAKHLGGSGADHCLLELLPLPSPSTNDWGYKRWTDDSVFSDRKRYRQSVAPWRADHLRKRIVEHGPKFVVFYGTSNINWWKRIAGVDFGERTIRGQRICETHDYPTRFIVIKHPARGMKNAHLDDLGRRLFRWRVCAGAS